MFYNRIVVRPQLGKAAQVRSLLKDRIVVSQTLGRAVLTERLFSKGPSFVVGRWFENLEAYEKMSESLAADSDYQAFVGQLNESMAEPADSQLYYVESDFGPASEATRYTHLVRFRPAPGKEAEVKAALDKMATAREAEGADPPATLRQVFTIEGPTYVLGNRYRNLTEYENIAVNRPPSIRNVIAETNDILAEPTAHALFRVLSSSAQG